MSNPVIRLAHAQGMGGLGNSIDDAFNRIGTSAGGGYDAGGGFDWNNFANTVGGTLSSIFGHNNSALAAQQQAALMAQLQAQAAARSATANNADDDSGGGIGLAFTDRGLRLGSTTTISYPTLGIAALALFLVQSSGFQKRR
jgi:Flp pilus assembly pilin Flp